MEHLESYLTADGIGLSNDLLDRIDEIVPRTHGQHRRQRVDISTSTLDAAFRRR
ncbi:hypothetical protein [Streptomyces sp. NPDC088246]|uniref:hypothetical protein n=1 Tax=Streptomyces sp. NPDC088246 TaxID=3365842 RepID=UPI00382511AC